MSREAVNKAIKTINDLSDGITYYYTYNDRLVKKHSLKKGLTIQFILEVSAYLEFVICQCEQKGHRGKSDSREQSHYHVDHHWHTEAICSTYMKGLSKVGPG